MNPPLGTYSPETRHLNLRWTVGDYDRRDFMAKNPRMTVEEVSARLHGTSLAASADRLREIAAHFSIRMRPSARMATS